MPPEQPVAVIRGTTFGPWHLPRIAQAARRNQVMSMSRTGRLILSCGGAATVVALGAVVWIGMESKSRTAEERRAEQGIVPAKLGPTEPPAPVSIPGTEGVTPGPVAPSLVLEKGETYYGK